MTTSDERRRRNDDAFRSAETANLRAWIRLSAEQKIDFFEEMIELAYQSGALRPDRLAMRDDVGSVKERPVKNEQEHAVNRVQKFGKGE